MNYTNIINVSNMMFWRVHYFALEIAKGKKGINEEFINKFENLKDKFGTTPDIDIDEQFTQKEMKFWSEIFTELAQKIFKRFYSNRPASFGKHSGLGLNIVKNIVELHKGTIAASNRIDTKGALVEVLLPKYS